MKFLIIMPSRIGDSIIASSVLNYFYHAYPGSSYTIACNKITASLFDDFPGLEQKIVFTKHKTGSHWIKIWTNTILKKWDFVIDLRGSCLSFCLYRATGLVWKSKHNNHQHHVLQLKQWLTKHSFHVAKFAPKIWLKQARITQKNVLLPSNTIAIAPFANWSGKTWPAEYFVQLLKRLIGQKGALPNYKLLFICAPNDKNRLDPILQSFNEQDIVSLNLSAHLLDVAAHIKACKLFLGNDSGIMHMAAALDIPTFGLFGPSNDKLYAPWGKNGFTIRTPEECDALLAQAQFNNKENFMKTLTVGEVYNKIDRNISNKIK